MTFSTSGDPVVPRGGGGVFLAFCIVHKIWKMVSRSKWMNGLISAEWNPRKPEACKDFLKSKKSEAEHERMVVIGRGQSRDGILCSDWPAAHGNWLWDMWEDAGAGFRLLVVVNQPSDQQRFSLHNSLRIWNRRLLTWKLNNRGTIRNQGLFKYYVSS